MSGPYLDSQEHLWEELARIDQLVKAQTVRWRSTIAAGKPPHLWGMLHVTDQEVQDYLQWPFGPPGQPPQAGDGQYLRTAAGLAEAIAERRRRTQAPVTLRLDRLAELFGLSSLERDILLVCLLPEVDGRYRRLFGYLQDDASRMRPSAELVLDIVSPVHRNLVQGRCAFHPGAPLARHRLLASGPESQGEEPLPVRPVRLDDRIAGYLLGSDCPDGRLHGVLSIPEGPLVTMTDLIVEPAQHERLHRLVQWLDQGDTTCGKPSVLFLHGPRGVGRRTVARAVATAAGLPLLLADLPACLRIPGEFELLVGLAYREAALREAAVCWTGCEALLGTDHPAGRWEAVMDAAQTTAILTFAVSEYPWEPTARFSGGGFLRLDLAMPDFRVRDRLWQRHLPPPGDLADPALGRQGIARVLANAFQLTGGQIVDAVAAATSRARIRDPQRPKVTLEDLYDGCRRQTGHHLVSFGHRVQAGTELTFDDLVLPGSSRQQLEELRSRIANRSMVLTELGFERRLPLGRGLIAMFTGTSGTGKTMAAELLAREQGVDLFKIDLSTVVSKYVGETEKNLSQVFADAEYANAIIFFDEADALFGKRGEVKEARDRWANIEVNYLLQRVERYAGVLILASNLQQNLDDSFMRRINVIVEFPFPDATARGRIWRGVFPKGLRGPSDQELAELAERFALTGGNIKNIVVDAAFRALASDGGVPEIQVRHLVASTAREYQKLGKPITRDEFGERFHQWIDQDLLHQHPQGVGEWNGVRP